MGIIRVKKDEKYFTASNEPFNDKRLSWEARGVIGYLLSKPNNWNVRMEDLEKQGPAGNFKLRRILAELRQCGYMNRIRVTQKDNTFDWITEVYESPSQNPNPSKKTVKRRSSGGKSTSGSSTSGKPTDIGNTDSKNTESSKEAPKEKPKKEPPPIEVKLFREVTERYPNKVNYPGVVEIIQGVSRRLGRDCTADDLRPYYAAWCSKGFKPINLAWLSWAESGVIPEYNGKTLKGHEPKGFDAARKFLERHQQQGGQNG